MIETTPSPRVEEAIRLAHAERGAALRKVVRWIVRRGA